MAKREAASYVFDGPAMGSEHGVYVSNREYRRGDVITAETIAALSSEEKQSVENLLARGVIRRASADKARTAGEEV